MQTLKNLQAVSGIFFYLLGLIIFALALLLKNLPEGNWPMIALKTLDLPFGFSAILYGLTSFKLNFKQEEHTEIADALLIFGGVLTFLILLYLNFAFKDVV